MIFPLYFKKQNSLAETLWKCLNVVMVNEKYIGSYLELDWALSTWH